MTDTKQLERSVDALARAEAVTAAQTANGSQGALARVDLGRVLDLFTV